MSKVSIIGAGEVGASCATCLAERDSVNEITIIDIKQGLAEGKALDFYLGVLVIIGKNGIEHVIDLELDNDDKERFDVSQQEVRKTLTYL